MTYHNMPTFTHRQSEAGVSLLLSVLLLAAISAIVFSLAGIVFVEIKSSSDVLRTEPALYAVLGLTEESLYQYRRTVPSGTMNVTTCLPANLNLCATSGSTFNGVTLNNPTPALQTYYPNPKIDVVYAGTKNRYQLLPTNPNSFSQAYGRLDIDYLKTGVTGTLAITITEYLQDGTSTVITPSPLTSVSGTYTYSGFRDGAQYQVQLENLNSSGGDNISVSLTTYNTVGQLVGIPITTEQVVDVVAKYLGLTRKYTVKIPVN
jgi:hypothetical protein